MGQISTHNQFLDCHWLSILVSSSSTLLAATSEVEKLTTYTQLARCRCRQVRPAVTWEAVVCVLCGRDATGGAHVNNRAVQVICLS